VCLTFLFLFGRLFISRFVFASLWPAPLFCILLLLLLLWLLLLLLLLRTKLLGRRGPSKYSCCSESRVAQYRSSRVKPPWIEVAHTGETAPFATGIEQMESTTKIQIEYFLFQGS
jgi:hypothetical protein